MPSLIYITRIRPLSGELAQGLESAGFHVKSFAPGEITADECLLVMTSDAVLAGIQSSRQASGAGTLASSATELAGILQLPNLVRHSGSEAAVESAAGEPSALPGNGSAPTADGEAGTGNLAFVPSQSVRRVFAPLPSRAVERSQRSPDLGKSSQDKRGSVPVCPTLPAPARVIVALEQVSALVPAKSARGRQLMRVNVRPRKRLWQPAAIAFVLLIFSVVLLTSHVSLIPATTDATAVEAAKPDAQPDSDQAASLRKASTPPPRTAPRYISDYDFVAEDYTTHFGLRAQREMEVPHPKRRAQKQTVPKRIVVN